MLRARSMAKIVVGGIGCGVGALRPMLLLPWCCEDVDIGSSRGWRHCMMLDEVCSQMKNLALGEHLVIDSLPQVNIWTRPKNSAGVDARANT